MQIDNSNPQSKTSLIPYLLLAAALLEIQSHHVYSQCDIEGMEKDEVRSV
jgi:hypothetical protein